MKESLVAYVPVWHQGYENWFSRHRNAKWHILGESFLSEFPRLAFDIRALSPEQMARVVRSFMRKGVRVLEKDMLPIYGKIIMPGEDIMRTLAEQYFSANNVIFENVFLRFDMSKVTHLPDNHEIPAISFTEFDRQMMAFAQELSGKSPDWWRQVGAVAVKDGEVICGAYNTHFPTEYSVSIDGDPRSNFCAGEHIDKTSSGHAEAMLIADAGRGKGGLLGASLYCTVFPCPTCAYSIVRAGFSRVYYESGYSLLGAADILRKNGIELLHIVS